MLGGMPPQAVYSASLDLGTPTACGAAANVNRKHSVHSVKAGAEGTAEQNPCAADEPYGHPHLHAQVAERAHALAVSQADGLHAPLRPILQDAQHAPCAAACSQLHCART